MARCVNSSTGLIIQFGLFSRLRTWQDVDKCPLYQYLMWCSSPQQKVTWRNSFLLRQAQRQGAWEFLRNDRHCYTPSAIAMILDCSCINTTSVFVSQTTRCYAAPCNPQFVAREHGSSSDPTALQCKIKKYNFISFCGMFENLELESYLWGPGIAHSSTCVYTTLICY